MAACGLAALCGAATAQAQLTDPPDTSSPQAAVTDIQNTPQENQETIPDTASTPHYKDGSKIWRQVGGANFPKSSGDDPTALVTSSPTTYADNLFDVAFAPKRVDLGLAGGASCENPDPDHESGCRPVAFLYTDTPEGGERWQRFDFDGPGYIGAIAWIDGETAMAVGGDGTYPRRAPPYGKDIDGEPCQKSKPGEPYGVHCDQAGMARAWLYRAGEWCELGVDEECAGLPETMRGLTAVDFRQSTDLTESKLGFVGALGQIWRWQGAPFSGGGFDPVPYDNASPPSDLEVPGTPAEPNRFNFRVRDLRFAPTDYVQAYAVTEGCCTGHDTSDNPLFLTYSDRAGFGTTVKPRWVLHEMHDGAYLSFDLTASAAKPTRIVDQNHTLADVGTDVDRPRQAGVLGTDSFYGLTTGAASSTAAPGVSLIASPASTDSLSERSEVHQCPFGNTSVGAGSQPGQSGSAPRRLPTVVFTSARFLSGDGGLPGLCNSGPDWTVGELLAGSLQGHGRPGVAIQTKNAARTRSAANASATFQCDSQGNNCNVTPSPAPEEALSGTWEPTSEAQVRENLSTLAYIVDSYTLNSIEMLGETGSGWAVGDHGAIVRRSDSAGGISTKSEPTPPRLGSRRPGSFEEPAIEAPGAASGQIDGVPSLAERPKVTLDDPELVNAGSPDATFASTDATATEDVAQIVMSRDGSEGWAVGPNGPERFTSVADYYGTASFYRFEDGAWTRCDSVGVAGELPADPACAAMKPLRRYLNRQGEPRQVQIISAARVPLENDGHPENDDDFEVVAIGTSYIDSDHQPRDFDPVVIRYGEVSNGPPRWRFESLDSRRAISTPPGNQLFPFQVELRDVAFTAPDDGWILGRGPGAGGPNQLFHFNGESWSACSSDTCGSAQIPRSNDAPLRMTSAGNRVYLFGTRRIEVPGNDVVRTLVNASGQQTPVILFHERGGEWTHGSDDGGGGLDPGFESPSPSLFGMVRSLAVAPEPGGTYSGWAVGTFYDGGAVGEAEERSPIPPAALLLRLEPGASDWTPWKEEGALADYLTPQQLWGSSGRMAPEPHLQLSLANGTGSHEAFLAQRLSGRLFGFDPRAETWELIPTDRPPRLDGREETVHGPYQAIAADNQGGLWAAVKNRGEAVNGWKDGGQVFFYHYTDQPPAPVFEEVPQPFGDRNVILTSLVGSADGTLWAAGNASTLARYRRGTGWQTIQIPGWDPGRIVTRTSAVNALAVGSDGSGVAVGEAGRIANLSPEGVVLDEVASTLCGGSGLGPGCGTTRDLRSAAVAPDGSALVGGDSMALLYRPAAGRFERMPPPPGGSSSATITSISMPRPDRAYLTTDTGYVVGGRGGADGWQWTLENRGAFGTFLGGETPLRAIEVDASGRGYAVGDRGVVLERAPGDGSVWRRVRGPGTDNLTSVALPQGEGETALIGGENGVVWTAREGELQVARPADYFESDARGAVIQQDGRRARMTGPVVGMELLPGIGAGQTEAWVATTGVRGTGRLLHYTSAPSEPLLSPAAAVDPIRDVPARRSGELSFAAFGKSDCDLQSFCPAQLGTGEFSEVVLRRIRLAVEAEGADLALFTGDAADSTGLSGGATADLDQTGDPTAAVSGVDFAAVSDHPKTLGARKHRRFADFVSDPLAEAGVPLLGALGPGDLSRPLYQCNIGDCQAVAEQAKIGESLAWREGLAHQVAPWGEGDEPSTRSGLEVSASPESEAQAQSLPQASVDGGHEAVRPVEVGGGARTHYAADLLREGEPAARIVVVDSSLRGLSTADAAQDPVERDGQVGWLERMLCFRGQAVPSGGECTRERTQPAIVLSNTPTFSYGPVDPTALASDGTLLESLYLRYGVSAVISGRLGWNGLYYALRPGLHAPCPGDPYPEQPPGPGASLCESVSSRVPANPSGQDPERVLEDTSGASVSDILDQTQGSGIVPFVVASGAGGKFGPNGDADGTASEGFWHGYTLVRVAADGDPTDLIVEQRPIFDWLTVEGNRHVLGARQRLRLRGLGREPIAFSLDYGGAVTRYDEIGSQAVTHRYDLIATDPERPWLPLEDMAGAAQADGEDACGPYVCLDSRIATIDRTTGDARAGDGKYPDTHAIAMLSVGDRAATYPLLFKKSPSFVVKSAARGLSVPPISNPRTPPPPSNTAPPEVPPIPRIDIPTPPAPPAIPSLTAAAPPELQPPAPPAPPPPSQQPTPLDLSVAPPGISISTPTALIQPPTPPVNPAPPGGARKEARQRQAAAQKGGADGGEEASGDAQNTGGDLANGPPISQGTQATRLEHGPARQEYSFTRLESRDGGVPGLPIVAGLGLSALVLAVGFSTLRPGSRRRQPELPAPAFSRLRNRR